MSAPFFAKPEMNMGVFLYHAVVSKRPAKLARREWKYWMSANDFRRHLALLAGSAHPVLSLKDVWRSRKAIKLAPSILLAAPQPSPVVLTFDDGWESDFTVVWPLLVAAGLPATFFVNTATLGTAGHLRWSQVREMSAAGACFASHGHRHVDLTRLGPRALETEMRMSKDLLEGWVKQPVDFLAVPYGRVNRHVLDAAFRAGYRAVCTSDPRMAVPGAEMVSRVAIHAETKPHALASLIEGRRIPYWARQARAAILAPAKQLLRPPVPERTLSPETAR